MAETGEVRDIPEAKAFMDALQALMRKHRISITFDDPGRAFTLRKFREGDAARMFEADWSDK